MLNKMIATTALVTLTMTGAASAGSLSDPQVDAPVPAPAPAPVAYDWSGPSVGGQLSYGDVDTDGPTLEGDGALFGLRAYYDWQTQNVIYGVGLQYDAADIDLEGVATVDSVLRLAGRLGVDSGRNLFYGTAGYARATTDAGTVDVGASDGYFIGAGYEVFVADRTTLGAEVLYHRFDSFDNVATLEADVTTIGLNANFRF